MTIPNCEPAYAYRPIFSSSETDQCLALSYVEHRSRAVITPDATDLAVYSSLFFRSRQFGVETNQLQIECVEDPTPCVRVYYNSVLVETYLISIGTAGSIGDLRTQITNNATSLIDMPPLNFDVYDQRTAEDDSGALGVPNMPGIGPFSLTTLSNGAGPPSTIANLALLRTGPDRSIIIITTTEDVHGQDIEAPPSRRIQQWNGLAWISYCNNIQGDCPLEGTC